MIETAWQQLLANFALVTLFVAIWIQVRPTLQQRPELIRELALGSVLGVGVLVVLSMPFKVADGVQMDLRAALIALSGAFGGPISAAATLMFALAYRVYIGGAGMLSGIAGALLQALIGVMFYRNWKGKLGNRGVILVASLSSIGWFPAILLLPDMAFARFMATAAIPSTLAIFAAVLVPGFAIVSDRKRRETAQENQLYRAVIEALPDSLNVKDIDGAFILANPATAALIGADSSRALVGKTDFDFFSSKTAAAFREQEDAVWAGRNPITIEQSVSFPASEPRWLMTLKVPLLDQDGMPLGIVTHNRDISDRKKLERELEDSRQSLQEALTNMSDGVAVFDIGGNLLTTNRQYHEIFALSAHVATAGAHYLDIMRVCFERNEILNHRETSEIDRWMAVAAWSVRLESKRELRLSDGRWIEARSRRAENGHMFVVYSDISQTKSFEQELVTLNRRLETLASTDALTGLSNRRAFDLEVARQGQRMTETGMPLSVLMIDVDRFKQFNDTYGHQAGDDCLRKIAAVIAMHCDDNTTFCARYGGEELAVLLPGTDQASAILFASSLRSGIAALDIPHNTSEKGLVTVSIGVATAANGDLDHVDGVIKAADRALYQAKASGRDCVKSSSLHVSVGREAVI